MNLVIQDLNGELSASLEYGQSLALYTVPKEYSEDGYYLAEWNKDELEPVPACDNPKLVLQLRLEAEQSGGVKLVEEFKSQEITYAAM